MLIKNVASIRLIIRSGRNVPKAKTNEASTEFQKSDDFIKYISFRTAKQSGFLRERMFFLKRLVYKAIIIG